MPSAPLAAISIPSTQTIPQGALRDTGLDAVRCVATFMVILIHVSGTGFTKMMEWHWWAVNAYESMSRASVPLFFMLTGALLLNKNHTALSIARRIWRVAVPLLAWSIAYKLWNVLVGKQPFIDDVQNWLPAIFSNPVAGHLWYLYALIPAYAFMPVLSSFVQRNAFAMQCFVLGSGILFASVIPFINALNQRTVFGLGTGSFYIYGVYMLAGAVLYKARRPARRTVLAAAVIWASSIAAIAYGTYIYSAGKPVMNELFYEYYSPLVFLSTISAFVTIRALFGGKVGAGQRQQGILGRLSELSFGVYMVHPMVIWTCAIFGFGYDAFNKWFAIPVLAIAVAAVSGLITALLRKIPGVRKIVPG